MLEVKITDEIMFDLLSRASDSEHINNIGNSLILGCGSDRTAIIYNDFLIVKTPNWWELKTEQEIENQKNFQNHEERKNTFFTYNKRTFLIYSESQTAYELEVLKILPSEIIKQYGAELIMWGEWKGHFITFCERLIPVDEDAINFDEQQVITDAEALLVDMEKTMRQYPIKVRDIHAENFGYTKDGKLKFVDLGYWKRSLSTNFSVDWDSFEEWRCNACYDYSNYSNYSSEDYSS